MLKPNVWIEKWKIENVRKYYFKMNWEDKIASQLYDGNKRDLFYLPDTFKTEEKEEWLQKKMSASKHAILQTMQFMYMPENSDDESVDSMHCSEDDDDPFTSGQKSSSINVDEVMLSKEYVCLFLYQLQYNVCFDMGFKVTSGHSLDGKKILLSM